MGEGLMTASGGNFIDPEVKRNKRSPQCGVAPIELAESVGKGRVDFEQL